MNYLKPRSAAEIAWLDEKTLEGRAYYDAAQMNLLQLGHVFIQVKEKLLHGEWTEWVKENYDMSDRSAQVMMQAYNRFGTDEQYARLGRSKLIKMLSLPEGTEEAFVAEHNVAEMTAREVEAAVKKVRAEMTAAMNVRLEAAERMLADERRSRENAEKLAEEMAKQPKVINTAEPSREGGDLSPTSPSNSEGFAGRSCDAKAGQPTQELLDRLAEREKELAEAKQAIDQMTEQGNVELRETKRLLEIARQENESLQDEMDEQADRLGELEREKRQAEAEVQRLQDELDSTEPQMVIPAYRYELEEMEAAIHTFMSACSRLPLMNRAFAAMSANEREHWDELLLGIEVWSEGARGAMHEALEAAKEESYDPYGMQELLGTGRRTVSMGAFDVEFAAEEE